MEIKLSVATLVGQMHIAMDEARTSVRSPEDLIQGLRSYLTMFQAEGVPLRMKPRTPA